ncbi:PEP-utilizing enzyme, partial [Chloroflexota bacterium]
IRNNPIWCRKMAQRMREIDNGQELVALFVNEINPYLLKSYNILFAVTERYGLRVGSLRRKIERLVGKGEANRLLTSITQPGELLASLGPVAGLTKVASGEMSREEYMEKWGHRMASEMEVSIPRPCEDPSWLDRQLKELNQSPYDIDAMFARQRSELDDIWEQFRNRYPGKTKLIRNKFKKVAEDSRLREGTRSEYTRVYYICRLWCLRAGELTGIGDDAFFLNMDELHSLLSGKEAPMANIPIRKQTYEKYKKLPAYPRIICGRFDPLKWVADPDRCSDIFDSHEPPSERGEKTVSAKTIIGIPGSAGVAEGLVRRLDSPEEGDRLEQGEILVTSLTNIGWTLIFPRAGAIVTDIGAPLSHAAIVARELGIPGVINCGNATTRLYTGDRVRVDGIEGTVEILETRESSEA